MQQVQGTVTNAWSQAKTSKAGKNYTVNYIQMDSFPETISTGFKELFQTGQSVNINVDKKYGEMQYISDAMAPPPQGAPAPQQGAPVAPQGQPPVQKAEFPIAPGSRQISIIRQSSLKCAVEALGPVKDGQEIKAYAEEAIELALMFTDFGSGQDITDIMTGLKS